MTQTAPESRTGNTSQRERSSKNGKMHTGPQADLTKNPTKKGVPMSRIFTTPGVHPYDEVNWQSRDVVMTNWRDGTINFEQRGVEFPDFWAENAATIVTSKYFRGALGTPAREHSLKQVIDRVVLTYTAAGKKHGYFASDQDAEIFEHELTWALLHQVFSFNSPVWFNVGTASPQQVSACFILSVDDTMDSILDWYTEEGMIFKGGSGAGVNLSRIRSSKELLSSGGTASGPVSFMRGADASAGTIKSGGATRRAAKMVVLDVDHPDIEEFVQTKAREEDKIRALREAGFDMDLGGKDIVSVQYQNANNSVRVSDEFMQAVQEGTSFGLRARTTGEVIEQVDARELFGKISQAAWECADPGVQYDDTINDWHTCPQAGRITASNPCSEYVHLDDSSCNLASLNLLKFLREDDTFDAHAFVKVVELVITAMDISICFADFPTEKIGATTRAYRQLGIGYANLGALLMATGHGYDSEGGRAIAATITSLMTGAAYRRSAEMAAALAPYDGYARDEVGHRRVIAKHRAANQAITTVGEMDRAIAEHASLEWARCEEIGATNGWRNSQVSVLAPTGCLTGDTMITTDRGVQRLADLGDVWGQRWQNLGVDVSTDEGPQTATRFFINGEEPTRRIITTAGYRIQGTLTHRIKVVDPDTGAWVWKRLAEIAENDVVPVQMGTMVGQPRQVPLPVLDQAYYAGDREVQVPEYVDAELAELVGYFMGDGSLHAKGVRLCVANTDPDVLDRIAVLSKGLFNLTPAVSAQKGYQEVCLQSVRLARWWKAAGFAKTSPSEDHKGKGWHPRIPAAILESNDSSVYAAFLRGVFEADGTVLDGVPSVSTSSTAFADQLRSVLVVLGFPTTTCTTSSGWGGSIEQVRLRNMPHALRFLTRVGFMGGRKTALFAPENLPQTGCKDPIYLPEQVWLELVPIGSPLRKWVVQSINRGKGINRDLATQVLEATGDTRLRHALSYLYEKVKLNEDGGVQPTYDLSVPANVTYVAGGFISHNTIGLAMSCDTTGIEPDLALVKFKKLVGGASMQIVNQTIARALRKLGYTDDQVEQIVAYIAEHGHVVDAPALLPQHYEVFDCAVGERAIEPMGHVRMMAATQPFLSGAISKTVNMPESAGVDDIADIYFQGWKLGLKALAIYRNNSKVGQPLSNSKQKAPAASEPEPVRTEPVVEYKPIRKRLPKSRTSTTTSFTVSGAEGYMTASNYPDNGLGEVFLKMSKQGSTLAGIMDAFSIAVSIGLQYGVPLETYITKFVNMRFEPAGLTDDEDVRLASSVLDYIFRRLALDHLSFEQRSALGIYSAAERAHHVETGTYQLPYAQAEQGEAGQSPSTQAVAAVEADSLTEGSTPSLTEGSTPADARPAPTQVGSSAELIEAKLHHHVADAPLCMGCGTKMRAAGSCYVCEGCGSTSGCS